MHIGELAAADLDDAQRIVGAFLMGDRLMTFTDLGDAHDIAVAGLGAEGVVEPAFLTNHDAVATPLLTEAGLIVADAFGAAVIREAPVEKLSPARRKAVTLRLARLAAMRLSAAADAGWTASEAALTSSGL